MEGVFFVPHTAGSKLKKALQSQNEHLAQSLKVPSLRFVERSGTTIIEDVGQSDPWALDKCFERGDCWHCRGRLQLLQEAEERTTSKITGEATTTQPPEDCRTSLPGCTSEGLNYVLDCGTCRDKCIKRQYTIVLMAAQSVLAFYYVLKRVVFTCLLSVVQ